MTNYNYNGMNAHDIANKVIAKEEAYNNANVALMPFEVKCYYALAQTPIIHPALSPDRSRRKELLKELRSELLSRAEREDPFALYVLGQTNADLSAPATDEERRFLERSMNVGHIPAALSLLDRFYYGKKRSEPEAQSILLWLSEHIAADTSDGERYSYYSLISNEDKEREFALNFALNGDFGSVVRLSNRLGNISNFDSDERSFWETVEFLVLEHFYNKGAKHLGDSLGMKLINERGCERDVQKIKQIYIDLMLSFHYDRHALFSIVGVPHNEEGEDLYKAEHVCRLQIENGKKSNYWKLILIALLSGDISKLGAVCDEACAALSFDNIAKAYRMLRHAKAND